MGGPPGKEMDERDSTAEEGEAARLLVPRCIDSIVSEQIMDLESKNAQLMEELSTSRTLPSSTRSSADWLPRAPATHSLTGHRSPITRVAFHPIFSSLVSASEDATLKIWDWETGEFERTLKGHTKAVMDVEFDSKGNLLGKLLFCCPDIRCVITDYKIQLYYSVVLVRFDIEGLGLEQRLQEHQDTIWS
jgi:WD40 repeat protein